MGRELVTYSKDGKEITFKYDENGLRHRKTIKENGELSEQYDYVWSDGVLISQTYFDIEDNKTVFTASAKFIYDSWGTLQGFILNDSETYLYVKNLQGDIIAIVDENGQVIVEYSYDAWGNVTLSESSLQNMSKASTLCFVSPFTYRGYCYDYDIELYYLQSRYYSAEIGRFINTDDTQIAIATMGTVLGANLFAYCENNPVVNVDYTGYFKVRRWMISAPLDMLFMATPFGAIFAPIKSAAKTMGLAIIKNRFAPTLFKGITWLCKNLLKYANKIVNLLKSIKTIKNIKFIKNLSGANLAGSVLGFALIKTPTYTFLNLLIKNVDIILSLGGFISGILDLCIDGKVNNIIWEF